MRRRQVPALVLGGLWWWAVLRLVLRPEQAGLVEGAVAAGGWGLSLLPVHVASVVPLPPGAGRRLDHDSGPRAEPGGEGWDGLGGGGRRRAAGPLTGAWRRRRADRRI